MQSAVSLTSQRRSEIWGRHRGSVRQALAMSPFIRLENSPGARSSSFLGLPLLTRKNRPPLRERESFQSRSPGKSLAHFTASKRRYFYLNDSGSLYDISGKSVRKVPYTQDVDEAKSWVSQSRSESPEVALRVVAEDLQSHLTTLQSDRKRMQGIKFEAPSYSPLAVSAFRELKLGNNHKVRELVTVYPWLAHVVDAVLSTQTQQTLLHWACKRGNVDIAVFLIDRGADPDKTNLAGRTARQIADKKTLSRVYGHMNYVKPVKKLTPSRWKSVVRD